MPNRTIYLPDDVDELARSLDVNLSKVTQDAIRALDAERHAESFEEKLARLDRLVRDADLQYPENHLADMRAEAGDDLR